MCPDRGLGGRWAGNAPAGLGSLLCRPMGLRSDGFALPAAIFLMVVLALLGVFVSRIVGMQQQGSRLDVQGARAYQAARAGIEWGLYAVLSPATTGPCPATANLAPGTGFDGLVVTVACAQSTVTEGTTTSTLYRLTATACNQPTGAGACPNTAPGDGYVMRQIEVGTGR